eukprot:scaffold79040_cov19-Tisochrysis_lutea.AAC.1
MPCMHPSDLQRATGHVESADADAKRLNRVLQLTGLSDPVYAEAYVTCKGAEAYKCMLSSKVVQVWVYRFTRISHQNALPGLSAREQVIRKEFPGCG